MAPLWLKIAVSAAPGECVIVRRARVDALGVAGSLGLRKKKVKKKPDFGGTKGICPSNLHKRAVAMAGW